MCMLLETLGTISFQWTDGGDKGENGAPLFVYVFCGPILSKQQHIRYKVPDSLKSEVCFYNGNETFLARAATRSPTEHASSGGDNIYRSVSSVIFPPPLPCYLSNQGSQRDA